MWIFFPEFIFMWVLSNKEMVLWWPIHVQFESVFNLEIQPNANSNGNTFGRVYGVYPHVL